jgi:transcriptional regulator with XRE-family HTH domain
MQNRLLRLMYERNLSDGALAALTGLSRARINRLKNHRARLTVRDALLIAKAVGAMTDTLMVEGEASARVTPGPAPRDSGAAAGDTLGDAHSSPRSMASRVGN